MVETTSIRSCDPERPDAGCRSGAVVRCRTLVAHHLSRAVRRQPHQPARPATPPLGSPASSAPGRTATDGRSPAGGTPGPRASAPASRLSMRLVEPLGQRAAEDRLDRPGADGRHPRAVDPPPDRHRRTTHTRAPREPPGPATETPTTPTAEAGPALATPPRTTRSPKGFPGAVTPRRHRHHRPR